MRNTTIAAIALGLIAVACSSNEEARREDEQAAMQAPAQQTAPKVGVVASVNNQRLMLDDAAAPGEEKEIFERTTRSIVTRDGNEIGWDQLQEGDVVRVTWDRGLFGPDRAARVEVLPEHEASRVRAKMENEGAEEQPGVGGPLGPREVSPPSGTGEPSEPGITPGTGTGTESGPVEPGY